MSDKTDAHDRPEQSEVSAELDSTAQLAEINSTPPYRDPRSMRLRGARFGIRTMLLSVAMIAIGFATMCLMRGTGGYLQIACWFVGGAIVGAGILYPFRLARLGALLGLVVQGLIGAWWIHEFAKIRG